MPSLTRDLLASEDFRSPCKTIKEKQA